MHSRTKINVQMPKDFGGPEEKGERGKNKQTNPKHIVMNWGNLVWLNEIQYK